MKNFVNHFIILFPFIIAFNSYKASVRYVNISNGDGISPYTSWSNASNDLQKVINASEVGDEIWIAKGIYKPNSIPPNLIPSSGTTLSNRDYSFFLKDGIKIYGGFIGNETQMNQRNILVNQTILSGDIGNSSNSDNCYHIIMAINNSGIGIAIDGFYITGANGNGGSSVILNNHTILRQNGGGIYIYKGSNNVQNNVIHHNYAGYAGGMYFSSSSSALNANNNITKNLIHNNSGGGIYAGSSNNTYTMYNIEENIIYNNSFGAGIHVSEGLNYIINNVLYNNSSSTFGSALYIYSGRSRITNNTIYGNTGCAAYTFYGNNHFKNNIFWENKRYGRNDEPGADYSYYNITSFNTFTNNLMQLDATKYTSANFNDFDSAIDNIFAVNPLFIDGNNLFGSDNIPFTNDDGLFLNITSPCKDSGSNVDSPLTDILGNLRSNPDIGAYEFTNNLGAFDLLSNEKMIFYPNPTNDFIFFSEELKNIIINSIEGKNIIFQESFSKKLDLSHLPAGLYLIYAKTAKGKMVFSKFIKK